MPKKQVFLHKKLTTLFNPLEIRASLFGD